MTTGIPFARCAFAALFALSVLSIVPASTAAKAVQAELRVLTPTQVLDPGTNYVIEQPITVATSPDADCFGPPGGSGAEFTFDSPNALGLLASGAGATAKLRPLSLTDQFGFGLGICGIGAAEAGSGTFWYLKKNHAETTTGADGTEVANGDQILLYLAPDNFPSPNPDELELIAPARTRPSEPFTVTVLEHGCVTDQSTFETTCQTLPAQGVTVSGGTAPATTGVDGTAQVTAGAGSKAKLAATRGSDIPSKVVRVCVNEDLDACPARFGKRIVGLSERDRLKGTKGSDVIRARGGNDRIDIRNGAPDRVDCGAGRDKVLVKRSDDDDRLAGDCERTRRR
jgi:hypothetical protein